MTMARNLTRFEMNYRAVGAQILKSENLLNMLDGIAHRIAEAANGGKDVGFVPASVMGRNRAMARVDGSTKRANRGEAKDHRLLRAVDAGRM